MSDTLRILYVGTLPPHQGGSAVACWQLLRQLAGRGHAVRALAPIADAPAPPAMAAAEGPRLRVSRFQVDRHQTSPDRPPSGEYLARKRETLDRLVPALMDEHRPDVVVIGRESFAWCVPRVAGAGVPCLVQAHGALVAGILNGTYPPDLADELLGCIDRAAGVQVPARHLQATLHELGVKTVVAIPNAVDTEQFRPRGRDPALAAALGIDQGDVVAAHASNLKPLKRPLDLVESAEVALRRDPRLLYLVIGDGELRAPMEEACSRMGISARFRFTGWIDHAAVARHVNLADLMILPSESEAQALAYLEAQACGCTLIASDIPGAREVVEHGEDGLLFQSGDVDALAEQTLRAAADSELRSRIGHRARERTIEGHSLDRVSAEHERLLRGVARGAPVGEEPCVRR